MIYADRLYIPTSSPKFSFEVETLYFISSENLTLNDKFGLGKKGKFVNL